MEIKFTEILCSIAEYNGLERNDTDYDGGAVVSYQTYMKDKPQKVIISENHKKLILELFSEDIDLDMDITTINDINHPHIYEKHVMKYDEYVKETFQKRPPQAPDYEDRPRQYLDEDEEEE